MKPGNLFAFGFIIVGCVGIGAWLVFEGHLWVGILAMVIGASVSYESK